MKYHRPDHSIKSIVTFSCLALLLSGVFTPEVFAGKAEKLRENAKESLEELYAAYPWAKALKDKAEGVLIFPNIIKGGFIIGGQYGDGALFRSGRASAYYRSLAASYGLQAGAQRFGYALFFMTQEDLNHIYLTDGWEIGVGPSLVIVDDDIALAKVLSTTTTKKGVYAFIFGQKGLMAGLGIQGTKITRIYPR